LGGVQLWQSEATRRLQPMEDNMERHVIVVVGLFVIASLASTFFYGLYPIVVCVIGLILIAALLRVLGGGS
jgi:hypothetical protein